jgi:hypothetical protein
MKNVVGDVMLNEALENFGFDVNPGILMIEVEHGGVDLAFPGWVSVGDTGSTLVFI